MGTLLTSSFLKTIKKRVGDCSNPIQLREYLNRYQNYVFSPEIYSIFTKRIKHFEWYFRNETIYINQCEDLREDLELEMQIATTCNNSLYKINQTGFKTTRSLTNNIDLTFLDMDCFEIECPFEESLLKDIFTNVNGNKMDICRILNISNSELNKKINQYKLKPLLNSIRREYRSKSEHKGRSHENKSTGITRKNK